MTEVLISTQVYRIGAVILALHDASDVFMEAAKVFKYPGMRLGQACSLPYFLLRGFY